MYAFFKVGQDKWRSEHLPKSRHDRTTTFVRNMSCFSGYQVFGQHHTGWSEHPDMNDIWRFKTHLYFNSMTMTSSWDLASVISPYTATTTTTTTTKLDAVRPGIPGRSAFSPGCFWSKVGPRSVLRDQFVGGNLRLLEVPCCNKKPKVLDHHHLAGCETEGKYVGSHLSCRYLKGSYFFKNKTLRFCQWGGFRKRRGRSADETSKRS